VAGRFFALIDGPDRLVDAELEEDVLLWIVLPDARRRDESPVVDRAARPATKNSPPTPSKLSIREWSAYRGSCLRSRTFGEIGHIPTSIRPAANHASSG
jgi:hypothetical protein